MALISLKVTLVLEEEMGKERALELMEFVVALAVKAVLSLFQRRQQRPQHNSCVLAGLCSAKSVSNTMTATQHPKICKSSATIFISVHLEFSLLPLNTPLVGWWLAAGGWW